MNNETRQLLTLANEYLKMAKIYAPPMACGNTSLDEVLNKLKTALVKPVQEPIALREALAASLTATYVCTRVWGAWNIGTMTEDDFIPASACDDLLDSLVEAHHGIGAKS
jgi:hypothetical protein